MRALLCFLSLAFVVAAPARSQPTTAQLPSVQLPPELDRVLRDYETRFRIGGDSLAAIFAEDGFVLSGGQPPVRGRTNIARHYSRAGGPLVLRAIAFAAEGDVGYIIGGYAYSPDGEDVGKFTLTVRREDGGRWMIFSDMDNSNRRPQPNSP
jgi:ketosteroid isomerase-like protein